MSLELLFYSLGLLAVLFYLYPGLLPLLRVFQSFLSLSPPLVDLSGQSLRRNQLYLVGILVLFHFDAWIRDYLIGFDELLRVLLGHCLSIAPTVDFGLYLCLVLG
jgi:hypothetical protein